MEVLVSYHSFLVYTLLGVVVLNLLVSYFIKDFEKFIFYSRIGYFMFWAAWAMSVFAGLIVFVFMKNPINLSTITMIIASILLPIIDGYRAIKLRKLWLSGSLGSSFSIKLLLLELAIILVTILIAIFK